MSMQAPVTIDLTDNPFGLSLRELKFCHEYFYNHMDNQTAAVIAAGYSAKGGSVSAVRLLERASIQNHLARMVTLNSDAKQRYEITADRIAREYAAIAFSHAVDYKEIMTSGDLSKLSYEQRAAIKSIKLHRDDMGNITTLDIRLHDKMQALDKLGQSLKMWEPEKKGDTHIHFNVEATRQLVDDIQGKLRRLSSPPDGEIIDG